LRRSARSIGAGGAAAAGAAFSDGFCTRFFTIFLLIFMALTFRFPWSLVYGDGSELAVVPLLQRLEQVGGGVLLTVVLDLFVAAHFHFAAILEREDVLRVLEVFLFHEHALEGFGIETERGAAL